MLPVHYFVSIPLVMLSLLSPGNIPSVQLRVMIRVEEDGSGTMTVVNAYNDELLELMGVDPGTDIGALTSQLEAGFAADGADVEVEEWSQDDHRGFEIIFAFDDLAELDDLISQVEIVRSLVRSLEVDRELGLLGSERYVIEGRMASEQDLTEPGLELNVAEVIVYLPGEVRETTGEITEDGGIRWTVDTEDTTDLYAVSEVSRLGGIAGDAGPIACMCAGLATFVVGIGFVLLRERQPRKLRRTAAQKSAEPEQMPDEDEP